jgi:predicted membrane protein
MEPSDNDVNRAGEMKNSRVLSGIILLTAGTLLLASKMGAPIPSWIFTWPVLLIGIGLLTGIKSRFHNPGALIMMVVGGIFLIDQSQPHLNFHNYILPAILIAVGIIFMLKPRHNWGHVSGKHKRKWQQYNQPAIEENPVNYVDTKNASGENAEYIEINTAFGSVKKIILSKNFTGGEINSFMAGNEINFMKADIQHPVVLEVNNVFGGTKLIIPASWDVKNEVTAVFGGIEDKRSVAGSIPEPQKVLLLKGACVFGGIEITNY